MRAIVSAGLLLLQVRPLVGVALCGVLSGAEGDRMEADCPMPEARPEARATSAGRLEPTDTFKGAVTDPAVTSLAGSHQCVFAELCTPSPPAFRPLRITLTNAPTEFQPLIWPSEDVLPTEGRAPPVPPPKL